ncbi:hypothetical protein BDV09DRAFT_179741 [Aspergillus tetrazonus]
MARRARGDSPVNRRKVTLTGTKGFSHDQAPLNADGRGWDIMAQLSEAVQGWEERPQAGAAQDAEGKVGGQKKKRDERERVESQSR